MTKDELAKIIDLGSRLNSEIKSKTKSLDEIKEALKKLAKSKKVFTLSGNKADVIFSASSKKPECNPIDFYETMQELDAESRFWEMISVSIEPARKFLGETLAEELITVCLLYTSPSPRDAHESRMPSSA